MNKDHPDRFIYKQCIRCATTMRDELGKVEEKDVFADVECLQNLKNGNKQFKDPVKLMFYTHNFAHIRAVCQAYVKETGEPIHNLINEMFGPNKLVLLNIANFAINPVQYFVETFRLYTRTLTADPNIVNSIILLRSELDLVTIKSEYERTTGKSLRDAIRNSSSGFYKYALYELIGEKRSDKR